MKHWGKGGRIYGWTHDRSEGKAGVHRSFYVHGLPTLAAAICDRRGHRPVWDGYNNVGRESGRWVVCARCGQRPTLEGITEEEARRISTGRRSGHTRPWPPLGSAYRMLWTLGWTRQADRPEGHGAEASVEVALGKTFSGVSAEVKVGGWGSENTLSAHLHLGRWLWLSVSERGYLGRLQRWNERVGPPAERGPSRAVHVGWHDGMLSWDLWANRSGEGPRLPKWRDGAWVPSRSLLGEHAVDYVDVEDADVVIPLPEGGYRATVALRKRIDRWARFRGPRVSWYAEITPEQPVPPVPGKGENSWDCDDNGYYSSAASVGGPDDEWRAKAVARYVQSVLTTRERYGGRSWTPSAGWPEQRIPLGAPATP